jgi:uncharacterized protein YdaU (DUF1376 family)
MSKYNFNVTAYMANTSHLTQIEHYIYRRLIDECVLGGGCIFLTMPCIKRRLLLSQGQMIALGDVLSEFFRETKKGWVHNNSDVFRK